MLVLSTTFTVQQDIQVKESNFEVNMKPNHLAECRTSITKGLKIYLVISTPQITTFAIPWEIQNQECQNSLSLATCLLGIS